AGAIGTREAEFEFLLRIFRPRQIGAALAYIHDAAPVARKFARELHRLVAVAARRDKYAIRARAGSRAAKRLDEPLELCPALRRAGGGAASQRQAAAFGINIDAEGVNARRAQNADEDLPEQTEADHHRRFAE